MNGRIVDALTGSRCVCVETAVFIYYLEDQGAYATLVEPLFGAVGSGRFSGISSCLTLAEALVKPLRMGRHDLAEAYRRALGESFRIRLYPLNRPVAEKAARIAADHNIKPPDAVQLATAALYEADAFVTNDRRLRRFQEMKVIVLDDFLS